MIKDSVTLGVLCVGAGRREVECEMEGEGQVECEMEGERLSVRWKERG